MPTLTDLFRRLEHLNEIGAALSAERDIDVLLEKILLAAKEITRADGGTLYRPTADGRSLQFAIVRTDSARSRKVCNRARSSAGVRAGSSSKG